MDNKYMIVLVWSEEDEAFLAKAPQLPGVFADGETQVEALQNVQIVIDDYLRLAEEEGVKAEQPVFYDHFDEIDQEKQQAYLQAVEARAAELVRQSQSIPRPEFWHKVGPTGREISPVCEPR